MTCEDFKNQYETVIDGRATGSDAAQIEGHAQTCPLCAQQMQKTRALSSALRSDALRFKAPASLRRNIEALGKAPNNPILASESRSRKWGRGWASVAASVVLAFSASWIAFRATTPTRDELTSREVISSHIRSLMVEHISDVVSTDKHTVKPWFTGKLSFSPRVEDFSKQEFPLIGGRLDYIGETTVAALIYQRRKHLINVFIWPTSEAATTAPTAESQRGYNVLHWNADGMTYWAVSDSSMDGLKELYQLMEAKN